MLEAETGEGNGRQLTAFSSQLAAGLRVHVVVGLVWAASDSTTEDTENTEQR